jgi:uncharacterized SAM-binding protein YcdF (DUF218 family)
MDIALWLAKTYLVPGSVWFLVVGLAFGVALLFTGAVAWGRRWLTLLALAYLALGMPAVALALRDTLGRHAPIATAADAQGATTIVLLGNGVVTVGPPETAIDLPGVETAMNVSEAARLYRVLGRRRIISSGGRPVGGVGRRPEGEVMRDYLLRMGVAADDVSVEPASRNTVEQAANVAPLLPAGTRVLLVTEPTHMRRALALFRARGLDVVPAVSGWLPGVELGWGARLVPNRYALRLSERVVYEYLGLIYYGLLGRTAG